MPLLLRTLLLAPLLGACHPGVPAPCVDMCAQAAALYGGCLEDWGVAWEAAGYADDADFQDRCETWAWELALLEQDAVRSGEAEGGELAATCTSREAELAVAREADPPECEAYTGVDWSALPWQEEEASDTGG